MLPLPWIVDHLFPANVPTSASHRARRRRSTAPRRLTAEALEERRLLSGTPQVTETTPSLAGGALSEGATSLQVHFSEPMLGAEAVGNYHLQSLGTDGLLGTADDTPIALSAASSGATATLTCAALTPSVYRLTIGDTITAGDGRRLDGDGDGMEGGEWIAEFVVCPASELFSATPTYNTGGRSSMAVASGDFNADGRPDVVVANNANATVSVLLGQAGGTLGTATPYASGGLAPRSVAIGDVNGDGRPDVVVANSANGRVGVLLGQANGTLAAASVSTSGGSQPYGVAIGDVNGDGRADVAVANKGSGTIGVLLGQASGMLAAAAVYSCGGTSPYAVAIGDFNGDGCGDVASANYGSGQVAILSGQPNGKLAAAVAYGAAGASPNSVAIADFNGDGRRDVAVSHEGSGTVGVLLGQAGGTLGTAATYPCTASAPMAVACGDFNDDALADLAVVQQGDESVAVLLGQGEGTLESAAAYSSGGTYPYAVAVADFNGDGRADLAAVNAGTNNVGVLVAQGAGRFAATDAFACGGNAPWSLTAGDLDADGCDDLVAANAESHQVGILLGQAGGVAPAAVCPSGGELPWATAIGELNGDGLADLAVVNSGSGTVAVLAGQADGNWALAATCNTTGFSPWDVAIGDFNADGRGDLVATNFYAGNVAVFLSQAGGAWAPAQTHDCGGDHAGSLSVAIGELNGDGRADLAVANFNAGNVAVLAGQADGTFAGLATYLTGGSSPHAVAIGDVNGDGRADLAVANSASRNVGILLAQPNGTLAAAVTCDSGGASPLSVAIGDLNADGRADLAVANSGSNNVAVLVGQAGGTLAAPVAFSCGGKSPRSLAIGDLNGDRRPDLAVANEQSDNVGVLWNTSAYPLYSPSHSWFDVQTSGTMAGQVVQGGPSAFDGLGRLQVGAADYAPPAQHADLRQGEQTLILPTQSLAGLAVHREITVPCCGSADFVQTVDVFSNATASPITTSVRIVGNLGSDGDTEIWMTSDGDRAAETTDQWIGTDDGDGTGTPAIVHYFAGPAGLHPSTVRVAGDRGDNVEWVYELSVPPGQTVRLAQLTIVAASRAEAEAAARGLVTPAGFAGQAAALVAPGEQATIANFVFAANHPPAGADTVLTMREDDRYAFSIDDFGFCDPLDSPSHSLLAVKIVTVPQAGGLWHDDTAVAAGDWVTAAEIQAGRLTFAPAADGNGAAYASFQFQVQDDGGAGQDLDPTPNTITLDVTAVADVTGRYVFYNNSAWDGYQAELNERDYDAISTTTTDFGGDSSAPQRRDGDLGKRALQPGQTASIANYTCYSHGLNGLVLTFDHLADPAGLTASDFEFRVGNSDTPADWPAAPAPSGLRIEPNASHSVFGGQPDVVTLRWADEDPYTPARESGAICNQWLQVTVLATAHTGLATADVFYFGNQIGESGNSATDANVDQNDEIGARNHPHTAFDTAPLSGAYDFNFDGRVDQNDEILVRNNMASAFTRIQLITAPSMLQADGTSAASTGAGVPELLTSCSLAPTVAEAMARWRSAGLSAAQLATLGQVRWSVADLPGNTLAEAAPRARRVDVDRDAAGFGWLVDATLADEEFALAAGGDSRAAVRQSAAYDRMDLLSVVMHEMGHLLGRPDLDAVADDLMAGRLPEGLRRGLPGPPQEANRLRGGTSNERSGDEGL